MDHTNQLTCEQTHKRLDDYIDQALTLEDMCAVRKHLKNCMPCADKLKSDMGQLSCIRTTINGVTVPEDLMEKISSAIAKDCGEERTKRQVNKWANGQIGK